jgi:hypothetical protein
MEKVPESLRIPYLREGTLVPENSLLKTPTNLKRLVGVQKNLEIEIHTIYL